MLPAVRRLAASAVLCVAAAPFAMAQEANPVTWELAVLKGDIVKQSSQELGKPIGMKNGDKFQIYLRVIEPGASVYVLFNGSDGSLSPICSITLDANSALMLPSPDETYTITPPGGTEYLYVLVSSARQTALEKLLKARTVDANAVLEEIKRIQLTGSKLTEVPQKPVPMGGVSRNRLEFLKATQFEGKGSYVQIIRLDH
jgi:hypothetical protein